MFFNQAWRNAAKNRKGNSLFFGSLEIAVIAFYTLLSLGEQDVMRFLGRIESNAVHKLLTLIPVVYIVSLFFVFFLVYFAYSYQLDDRRKEFGLYLILGMKRSRLLAMLLCETLCNSLISLLIGLPAALFLTEAISLTTAKAIGLGIIEHKVSLSPNAIIWTICGFIAVQLISMLIICVRFGRTEPSDFMRSASTDKQTVISNKKSTLCFVLGIVLLITAYVLGILYLKNFDFTLLLLLASGAGGTFLLYRGLGGYIGNRIQRKAPGNSGLATFTGRQIQENVLHQYKALAVSSLLLLMALSCISYGIGMVAGSGFAESRTTDFSIQGTESEVSAVLLNNEEIKSMTQTAYPFYLSRLNTHCNTDNLVKALEKLPESSLRDNIIVNISDCCEYILSESSYNNLLIAIGKRPILLKDNQAALYSSMNRSGSFFSVLDEALKHNVTVEINGTGYELLPDLYHDNIVADRAITLYAAIILPDRLYNELASDTEPFCWNIHLAESLTDELGLMQAIEKMDLQLSGCSLKYESFLGGIGRNLFYTVAASYLTIYLGVLFLIISNTVIGLKYLIHQRKNKHRYITLLMLGADTDSLCQSTKKQIQAFFSMAMCVAVFNSVFAIFSMFTSFAKLPDNVSIIIVVILTSAALLLFIMTEIIYVNIVKHYACLEVRKLNVTDRG